MRKGIPDATKTAISAERERLFSILDTSGATTKKAADQIVESAWAHTYTARDTKDIPEELAKVWKQAGLEGQPPADLTRKVLLNTLWEETRKKANALWNTHFDTAFAESENLKNNLSKFVDTTT